MDSTSDSFVQEAAGALLVKIGNRLRGLPDSFMGDIGYGRDAPASWETERSLEGIFRQLVDGVETQPGETDAKLRQVASVVAACSERVESNHADLMAAFETLLSRVNSERARRRELIGATILETDARLTALEVEVDSVLERLRAARDLGDAGRILEATEAVKAVQQKYWTFARMLGASVLLFADRLNAIQESLDAALEPEAVGS
jgi:hypothetical protein